MGLPVWTPQPRKVCYEGASSDTTGYKSPAAQHTNQRTTQQTLVILPPHIARALDTLGMPNDTLPTKAALTSQYRQLAMLHHPDHHGNAETFKTVTIARQIVLAYIELRERVGNAWNVA